MKCSHLIFVLTKENFFCLHKGFLKDCTAKVDETTYPTKFSKSSRKKKKRNYVNCEFVQTRPKPRKTKETTNSSAIDPSTHKAMDDLPHPHTKNGFYLWFD